MIKKHGILLAMVLGILLLFIAAQYYPGGALYNPRSIGYDWKNNYLSNLFMPIALNGATNGARYWAVAGVFFLCLGMGLFFYKFSDKIIAKTPAGIIRYCGIASAIFGFLAVTPYHDSMVRIASICALLALFYITVFILRSKLLFFKMLSVICIATLYFINFIYYTRVLLSILPVMQKLNVLITVIWMLGLQYFTTKEDFLPAKNN